VTADSPLRLAILITGFTLAAGLLDSLAFTYSAGIWKGGRLVWLQASKAAGTFALGITMYWFAIRYLAEAGVVIPEIQTLIWFTVTIVGVTFLGGRFIHWPLLDQVVATNVLVSLGWLITRTSA
jgi:hypothetical protein